MQILPLPLIQLLLLTHQQKPNISSSNNSALSKSSSKKIFTLLNSSSSKNFSQKSSAPFNWQDSMSFYLSIARPYKIFFGVILLFVIFNALGEMAQNFMFKLVLDGSTNYL
jgi:hypothetical protein